MPSVHCYEPNRESPGTLIAPDLVLTAANCVVDSVRKTVFRPDDIRFVAGVFRDTSRGMSSAACVRFPPGYKVGEFGGTDLALIVLKHPIEKVQPLRLDQGNEAKTGTAVTHAGYPGTRRFILSIHDGCRIEANVLGRFATNCKAIHGSSGGPLLSMDGTPAIIGVLSGINVAGQTIFTRFSGWPDLPENGECP